MDWVSNGDKYNVEFNFGMVDTESIMARVESSKESLRNSTMVDADGSNEVQGVNLTPKGWATLCKQKQDGWFKRNGTYSLEQVEAEIERLQRLQLSYAALRTVSMATPPTYPIAEPDKAKPAKTEDQSDTDLKTKFTNIYNAEAAFATQNALVRDMDAAAATDYKSKDPYKAAMTSLMTARKDLDAEIKANMKNHSDWTKSNLAHLEGDARKSTDDWLKAKEAAIVDQIAKLQLKKTAKQATQPARVPAIASADNDDGQVGSIVAAEGSELADPLFQVQPPDGTIDVQPAPVTPATGGGTAVPAAGSESDPWVTISASFSAEDQKSTSSTSSWGMSVGGGFGWGLWSAGGSYSHDQSQSDSQADMASCDVSVTFDALVVNIGRPWLYAELFNDFELDVADHIMLSPGAERLKQLMATQAAKITDPTDAGKADQSVLSELAQYNSFPAFPTSFILAANTSIEVSNIETRYVCNVADCS